MQSGSQDSSLGIVMGYRLDGQGLIPSRGQIFLFSMVSKLALGPTQPPIQWVPWGDFAGGKVASAWSWPPLPSSKVKKGGVIPPLPIHLYGIVFD
jgi:hypothetical protein